MPSPYEVVLGDLVAELHPQLGTYFGAIPDGCVGYGSGRFATVGTPRRWLWPVLGVLRRQGVLAPVWEKDVAFTVVNRPSASADGGAAVTGERTFHLRGGDFTMVDQVSVDRGGLVDQIGS